MKKFIVSAFLMFIISGTIFTQDGSQWNIVIAGIENKTENQAEAHLESVIHRSIVNALYAAPQNLESELR
jgi:intracellular sulfur oxidation DsrE/DsrF family protein